MNAYPITSPPIAVGRGFEVEFSFDGQRMDCQWSPDVPAGRDRDAIMLEYRAARTGFYEKIFRITGLRMAALDDVLRDLEDR